MSFRPLTLSLYLDLNHSLKFSKATVLGFVAVLGLALPSQAQIPTGVTFETIYNTTQTSFIQPTGIGPVPGNPNQMVVIERAGNISLLEGTGVNYQKKPWFKLEADTTTHWDGAWSLEFHPAFPTKPLFYVLYRQKVRTTSVIEEWQVDGASLANPKKVRNIIEFPQKDIHSSGDMHFGPDGFLYTSQSDRRQSGQDHAQLWGKVLRIDVNKTEGANGYSIPSDNPYIGQAGTVPEAWAVGFRVPYRFSFDAKNGDLLLGDVGETSHEEVNLVLKGKNYGAGIVEGKCTATNCATFADPIWSLTRGEGGCIIGGIVYRNDSASKFYGVYIVADYQNKLLYGMKMNSEKTNVLEKQSIGTNVPGFLSTMGQDDAGNLYVATYVEMGISTKSHIYRLKHPELTPMTTSLRQSFFQEKAKTKRQWKLNPFPVPHAMQEETRHIDGRIQSRECLSKACLTMRWIKR